MDTIYLHNIEYNIIQYPSGVYKTDGRVRSCGA
jgi:hypothetical protein